MSGKLANLQALRGIACLLVVLTHIHCLEAALVPVARDWLAPIGLFGFAGVDLFFVLSGFVITFISHATLGHPSALPSYAFRRFWRVYPPYWACWFGSLAVLRGLGWDHSVDVKTALTSLLLIRSDPAVIWPAWTLVYEVIFYTAFAGFFLLPRRAFAPVLAAWAVVVVAVNIGQHPLDPPLPLRLFVLEFLAGCVVGTAIAQGSTAGWQIALVGGVFGWAVAAGLAIAGVTRPEVELWGRVLMFGGASTALVYGLVGMERSGGRVLPGWLQAIGEASYALYLTHVLVILTVLTLGLRMQFNFWGRLKYPLGLIGMVAAGVAVGFLVHHTIERPLMRRGRTTPKPSAAMPRAAKRAA